MMKRVSSRQRLVSWDAFDATEQDGESSQSDVEPNPLDSFTLALEAYNIRTTYSLDAYCSLKRKREAALKAATSPPSTAIEAYACEVPQKDCFAPISSVNDDVKLRILSFLEPADVRVMMQASKRFYKLVSSDEASLLWKQFCQKQWPFCKALNTDFNTQIELPSASFEMLTGDDGYDASEANFNALLQLAPIMFPACIDESIFAPCRWSRSLRRYQLRRAPLATELTTILLGNGEKAVHFTGAVGSGDRCIRSDQPFARPQERERPLAAKGPLSQLFNGKNNRESASSPFHARRNFFLDRLRRTKTDDNFASQLLWNPFVVPHVVSSDGDRVTMSLTPRLVHYFEVKVLEAPKDKSVRPQTTGEEEPTATRFASECVAVGLSTNQFSLHTRMPGWCSHSFGFHGDDGGVFHSTGHMLRDYGPTFGVGDVVGCGLDYHRNAIFFTLNGTYLGDAFNNLGRDECTDFHEHDWYPTVGIDTKCLVQCNFGTAEAFSFDLEQYVKENHLDSIEKSMCS